MAAAQLTALRDVDGFQHAEDDYWYRPLVMGDALFSYVAHVPPAGYMAPSAEEAEMFELSLFMLGSRCTSSTATTRSTSPLARRSISPGVCPSGCATTPTRSRPSC